MKNPAFHHLLRQRFDAEGRRMNVKRLAAQIGAGRSHLTQVLRGVPGRGGRTRAKLFRALTAEEIAALPAAPISDQKRSTGNNVPIPNLSQTTNQTP